MAGKKYLFYVSQNYSYAILRPVQEEIIARGDFVAWFAHGKSIERSYFRDNERVLHTLDDIFEYNPDAIFYPSNQAPTFLPGINVAVFHGFDAGKLDKKGNNDHFKIRNCFDLYCTQGPDSTTKFKALMSEPRHFEVVETGWCALDPLFTHDSVINQRPKILLCSTFSKKLSCAPHLLEEIKRISQNGEWDWIVQFHPKMPLDIVNQYKAIQSKHLTFVETDDVIPLLAEADLMVCDTSSVLIMFILQGKPVVTFKNIAPGDYLLDIDDPATLEQTIRKGLSKPNDLMLAINRYIQQQHPYQDGKSSARLLDAVNTTIEHRSKLANKPIDIIRQFKMRRKLGYWKLF
ncbi:CDP-glycerol--glycerophosphate glycerophosphotransferase [Thalassotalea litorea]|uniref:CDP-glycerol--glycerophosphate glycerophosphotransferase n=1 Tax=Thalassotalea litorea TaxID=2020715 RepID=A0A5R9INY8_9GAMM|nr:CDP-glycerol--glycerophosphate glycerophosphotransferase [Thalassotalea litorea]TLU67265.1 CDP-glycerol--glycerophosphate glycerophosphotransferase [Thalassotalea litorea]